MSKKPYNPWMKIFYLGPEGTNSDLAARKIFTNNDIQLGNSIQKNNQQTMDNIFSDIIESIIGAIFIDSNIAI